MSSIDSIGCGCPVPTGCAVGGNRQSITAMIEGLTDQKQPADKLEAAVSQILTNGFDRTILAGNSAELIIMKPGEVTKKILRTRAD